MPGAGILNGKAWHDANFNRTMEANELLLEGWSVELYRNDRLLRHGPSRTVNGVYRISGVTPNYAIRRSLPVSCGFTAPDAGASSASCGMAYSQFTNGLQQSRDSSCSTPATCRT